MVFNNHKNKWIQGVSTCFYYITIKPGRMMTNHRYFRGQINERRELTRILFAAK